MDGIHLDVEADNAISTSINFARIPLICTLLGCCILVLPYFALRSLRSTFDLCCSTSLSHPSLSNSRNINLEMEKTHSRLTQKAAKLEFFVYWRRMDISKVHFVTLFRHSFEMNAEISLNSNSFFRIIKWVLFISRH